MIPLNHYRRELPQEGPAIARFIYLLDLGTQKVVSSWGASEMRKINISVELPEILSRSGDEKGKPMLVHNRFTATMGKKSALRPFIEGLRGKFSTDDEVAIWWRDAMWKMVGFPCQVSIVHSESKEYANLATAMLLMKNITCPPAVHQPLFFTMDPAMWNPAPGSKFEYPAAADIFKKYGPMKDVFAKIPEHLQKTISASKEYQAVSTGRSLEANQPDAGPEDDVPMDEHAPF